MSVATIPISEMFRVAANEFSKLVDEHKYVNALDYHSRLPEELKDYVTHCQESGWRYNIALRAVRVCRF